MSSIVPASARRSIARATHAVVVDVRRSTANAAVRFGPARARIETLEPRRLLCGVDGAIHDYNGVALPEGDSPVVAVGVLDDSGSTLELTTADGATSTVGLVTLDDGSQFYDYMMTMTSVDPIVDPTIDPTLYTLDTLPQGFEQAEGSATIDLADAVEGYPVLSLSIDADGVVSAAGVDAVSSDISGSIFVGDVVVPAHVVQQSDGSLALAEGYAPLTNVRYFAAGGLNPDGSDDGSGDGTTDDGTTDGGNVLVDPIPQLDFAEGTATIDLADATEAYPVLSLAIDADGVVTGTDGNGASIEGISSARDGSIYLGDQLLTAHVVQQDDGSLALAAGYRPETYIRYFTSGGVNPDGSGDGTTDDGNILVDPIPGFDQAEGSTTLGLADATEAYPVLSLAIDADGVVTGTDGNGAAIDGISSARDGSIYLSDQLLTAHVVQQADGSLALAAGYTPDTYIRTLTGGEGDGGEGGGISDGTGDEGDPIVVDDGGVVPTAYFGELTVTLPDFNGLGDTVVSVDDTGTVTAVSNGTSRVATIDDSGMVLIDGLATNLLFSTDGTQSGLMPIYTINDGIPVEITPPGFDKSVALADFNNWGVTEISVDGEGVVSAIADGASRVVTLDADTNAISVDGVATGYVLVRGREEGWGITAEELPVEKTPDVPLEEPVPSEGNGGEIPVPVMTATGGEATPAKEPVRFAAAPLAFIVRPASTLSSTLFASKSIVDADDTGRLSV
jgi:hypothetical protein